MMNIRNTSNTYPLIVVICNVTFCNIGIFADIQLVTYLLDFENNRQVSTFREMIINKTIVINLKIYNNYLFRI